MNDAVPGGSAIGIRRAGVSDAAALAVLRYRFRAELGQPVEAEGAFVARATPWLAERLRGDAWRAWVAVDAAGEIIGHIFAQAVEKIPNPVPEAETILYITNAYVVPALRGGGIGARLLEAALEERRELQVETVIP
ncbi:MAG: hypothetical protein AVDCRST_MAG88-1042, partial [uncultured Thermomicrobiales bacterium]